MEMRGGWGSPSSAAIAEVSGTAFEMFWADSGGLIANPRSTEVRA
jgi:hypothetical protein